MQTQTAPRNITAVPPSPTGAVATPAQLEGVTKSFGATVALRDLNLAIHPGELVALLGPNGAGKTTAVRLLLGLCAPSSGLARVFGRDPRRAANRTRTGAMLQIGRVPETLKVREHIDAFASYYPNPLPARQVMETAGLAGIENRAFGELSGGQKQRVLFALAICGNPDLLILDEPTVSLDVEARRGMWEQVRHFVRGGRSVLLTTHYLDEADALADRVVVIDHGQIIAEGTPDQIKARAAGKRIRCTTAIDIETIRALPGVASVTSDSAITSILASDADLVVRALILGDPHLAGLEVVSAGLEDAFLALTDSQKEVA
jgi:ABC-2 type transport system ATP-binding protein